jgi:NTE family protein
MSFPVTASTNKPKIGLALGGGAARGLAHIPMLEAFDEMGLQPAVIAGCSIGALVGAAYAGGMSAKEIREHAIKLLSNRLDMARHIFGARKVKPTELLSLKSFTSLQLDGVRLADIALPDHLPQNIEDMKIPFKVVTTDYDNMTERLITKGNVLEAVGASIAIPGLIAGPSIDGHTHVDGGVTNPVPFDHVRDGMDLVIAIDVTGKPREKNGKAQSNIEIAIGSLLIMFHQMAELRRSINPPDIYILPDVNGVGSADFFNVQAIFDAAEPAKQQLKRSLERNLKVLG